MKLSLNLQKLISFGYLFLIILGIFKESIFYYQLGINILNYSTITDILISPIADMAAHPVLLGAVVFMLLFSYLFLTLLSKKRNHKWAQIFSGLYNKQNLSDNEIKTHFSDLFTPFLAVTLFTFFVGIGFGEGKKVSQKIVGNQLEYDRKMNFNNGDVEDIYLVGSNSIYYFYVSKGDQHIKISPVGAIRSIELVINKALKYEK
jgi:hypothetical protein